MPAATGRTVSAVFALLLGGSLALSHPSQGDIKVDATIPKEAELGKTTKMQCFWKLSGNDSLYSVKWYKDEYEFYSYVPDKQEKVSINSRVGVIVDGRASKITHDLSVQVTLIDLTLNSSGRYKCEVSTGGPLFLTNYVTGNLTVISLPSRGPEITGFGTHYALGENVTANCTAWPSVPQAQLHWTVNNKTVPAEHVIKHKPHSAIENQGTPSSLGLRLALDARHMAGSGGALRLRCVSRVGTRLQEIERSAKLTHANNQRYSAGDLRNSATYVGVSLLLLMMMTTVAILT